MARRAEKGVEVKRVTGRRLRRGKRKRRRKRKRKRKRER